MFNQYPDILSVDDLRSALAIGRTKAYELVSTGQIQSFKIGNAIRIPKNSLLDYVNRNSYNVADASERPTWEGGYQ